MYEVSFYVPKYDTERVKLAMFEAGSGTNKSSNYTQCAWQTEGKGQFMPTQNAKPAIGKLDQLEIIPEYKVEMLCSSECINQVISAMKETHPYEEIAYSVVRMEDI